MTLIAVWLRLERGRRWRSLVVLGLLVAFTTATVLASLAGARRGASAVDRLYAQGLPATVTVLPNQPGFDWAAIRKLPEVEALSVFPMGLFWIDGIPITDNLGSSMPMDDDLMHTIERPAVLAGRIPDPDQPGEVAVSPTFLTRYHMRVGDRVTIELASKKQAADLGYDPTTDPLAGPRVPGVIVGVIKSPWLRDWMTQGGGMIASGALFRAYRDNFLGPSSYANALVRLRHGLDDLPSFRRGLAQVSKRSDIDIWDNGTRFRDPSRRADRFEAASLLAFGLAAFAAAVVLIGQTLARYAAATVADLQVLRAVGLTPRQASVVGASGPVLAALAGATVGVGGAAVASIWMPIGLAAASEPAPGFDLDWVVLGPGWILAPLLVFSGTAAAVTMLMARREVSGRRSTAALFAGRMGLPVPIVVGARFALEPRRGRDSVPVRPALIGAVVGVLGVLAAFTFAAGVRDASENPSRFGRTHQLEAFAGINGADFTPVQPLVDLLARDPDVASVNDARMGVAVSDRVAVSTFTYAPAKGAFPVILTSGRLPRTADEIALAPGSAEDLGVTLGDRVGFTGGATPVTLTVTGIGFVPLGPHNDYNDGGWITASGHDRLFEGARYAYKFRGLPIALRPGADPEVVAARLRTALSAAGIEQVGVGPPEPLAQLWVISDVQALPLLLAAFLAVLAVGAVGHALVTAVRRRRHEVAVMRALGMTRRQARATAVTQATLLAVTGLLFGVPLGVALGRVLWRLEADQMPLFYQPPIAVAALVLVGPAALIVANLLAVWPGREAARLRVGQVLRTE